MIKVIDTKKARWAIQFLKYIPFGHNWNELSLRKYPHSTCPELKYWFTFVLFNFMILELEYYEK